MARPAPSVERTVTLLKYLAEHPRERFTLSDIARRLEFNKATCHAMLNELVSQGMLIRHPADKAYMLGPALVNLGTAAAIDANEALDIARGEMRAIREELDVTCVASSMIGNDIVVLARADVSRPIFGYLPVGHRNPATPPYGGEFFAWAREDEVELWLDRHEPRLTVAQRDAYYSALDRIRLEGCQIAHIEHVMALRKILSRISALDGAKELEKTLARISDQTELLENPDISSIASPVMAIKAPIFGPSGRVMLTLNVSQFDDPTPSDIRRYKERLLEGTRRVTSALHGSEPFPQWARPTEAGGRLKTA